jgi:hypothetical protein
MFSAVKGGTGNEGNLGFAGAPAYISRSNRSFGRLETSIGVVP